VLVSAGFDAHRSDPLADLAWSAGDYAVLTTRVASYVPRGRVALFLEGGYDLAALRASVTATVRALAGDDRADAGEPPTSGGPGIDQVAMTAAALARVEV
jgi:acetoin utilization deacetylase AcuC-like enzyme